MNLIKKWSIIRRHRLVTIKAKSNPALKNILPIIKNIFQSHIFKAIWSGKFLFILKHDIGLSVATPAQHTAYPYRGIHCYPGYDAILVCHLGQGKERIKEL